MKNYILLLFLMLLCGPIYCQTAKPNPIKKEKVKTVKVVNEKNKQKVGKVIRKPKVQRRGDQTKGKRSVGNRNDDGRKINNSK